MSVETFSHLETNYSIEELAHERADIQAKLDGIMAATNAREASEQQTDFEEIGRIFTTAHDERVSELQREKQGIVLEAMLDNPADAFRAEFLQLKLLYENRTLQENLYDGSSTRRFCTQNHEAGKADSVFREYTSPSGAVTYEVRKEYTYSGEPRIGTVTLKNGALSVTEQGWHRGQTVYVELEGDSRDRMLADLFYGTILASALQFERSAEERIENDIRAKGYLYGLKRQQSSLL